MTNDPHTIITCNAGLGASDSRPCKGPRDAVEVRYEGSCGPSEPSLGCVTHAAALAAPLRKGTVTPGPSDLDGSATAGAQQLVDAWRAEWRHR